MMPDAHLLIVDDDERIRTLLKKYLIRNGFLVSAARDAAHAETKNARYRQGTGRVSIVLSTGIRPAFVRNPAVA